MRSLIFFVNNNIFAQKYLIKNEFKDNAELSNKVTPELEFFENQEELRTSFIRKKNFHMILIFIFNFNVPAESH